MRLDRPLCASLTWLLTGLLLLLPQQVEAAAGPWAENEHSRARLISASQAVGEADELRLGLQVQLAPGWKTYWRSPGDAGYPPSLDWSGSENLADARMQWPVPHRFSLFGLETFGYENEVVFPIKLRPERAGEPISLTAEVDYLVCSDICIPYQEIVRLELPAGPTAAAPTSFDIDRFAAQVPDDGRGSGIEMRRAAVIDAGGEAPLLEVVAYSSLPFEQPDVLIEGVSDWRFGAPEIELRDNGHEAVVRLPALSRAGGDSRPLLEQAPTLTFIDLGRGVERTMTLTSADRVSGRGLELAISLPMILLMALVGGLILNLMPCVLPVLSIKLLSAVSHGGRATAAVRLSFLASAAGIVFSFLVLAAGAIALKQTGVAVGWGMQFQQPAFLGLMALIVVVFAANLFGFFEIPLPGWLSGAAGRGREGLAGHFATGAFATLLATPCSAPFLGTAVGFALAAGTAEILMVFAALGIGLSLPYLLVAAVPRMATMLPRPGPWMLVLRRVLGFALLATAAWLLSVMATQVGLATALLSAALLAALLALLFAGRRFALAGRLVPLSAAAIALASLAVASMPVTRDLTGSGIDGESVVSAGTWRNLDATEIGRLVSAGKVVFVDVTADWCITCQVNKSLVLDRGSVVNLLADESVVTMRGDWTLPDAAIADYLASHGRYGIPFNAVYGPGAPDGVVLPELLSEGAVMSAIEKAAPKGSRLAARP